MGEKPEITTNVRYERGHFSAASWQQTEYHCPMCGQPGVLQETSGSDYYVGEDYACANCATIFNLPSIRSAGDEMWNGGSKTESYDDQKIEQMRKALYPGL